MHLSSKIFLAGGLFGLPLILNAQERTVDLPGYQISESEDPSLTLLSLESAQSELAKVAGGSEVVSAERYLTGRASTVADTFALSPGVFAQSRFGSDEARLSIRGSGLQRTFHGRGIRVMQDGIPLNQSDGGFDFQAIEPTAAAYINVWRGANAPAFGATTLGGAIDYISYNGRNSPPTSYRLEGGSYGYLRGTAMGGFSSDDIDAFGAITHFRVDGFRDHAEQRNNRFFGNLGIRLSETAETRFFLSATDTNSELPGSLTKAELYDDPRQADTSFYGSVNYDNRRDFELVRLANKTTIRSGSTLWNFSAGWTYKDLDHPITPFVGVIDYLSNDALVGVDFTLEGMLFGQSNQLVGGVLYTRGQTNAATFQNLAGERGPLVQDNDQVAENLEAFVENQLRFDSHWTLIAGFSAAQSDRKNTRLYTASTPNSPFYFPPAPGTILSYDRTFKHFSPRTGLRWDASDWQFFANISGSFEPPSFSEAVSGAGLSSAARQAQKGTTYEIGTRGEEGAIRWDVSLYHAKLRNELLVIVDPVSQTPLTTNADRTTHEGIEAGIEWDLIGSDDAESGENRLVFRGAWTLGDFTFDNDPVYGNNIIAGLPKHLLRAELLWMHIDGWYAGPTVEWVPEKSFIDHRNTFAADPYSLLGFKGGRRVSTGLSWFVELRNAFDKIYAATTGVIENANGMDQRQFLPGDGRSVFAGIDIRW
jgi:iron complex outermembrane recepter protein